MKAYLYAGIAIAIVAGLSTIYFKGYSDGKQSVLQRLQSDKVTVLQDGKRIDNVVLGADDDALYCMLIDCKRN